MALGTVASANASARFQQVSTDSRELLPGSLFVALRGARQDGHDHLASVAAAGATGAVVEQRKAIDLPQLVVSDTRVALGRMAEYWRRRLPLTLVAITGSNGKTTVKEMVAKILSQQGTTLATSGNQNNEIGVPLTLLRARPYHQYAVVEMGMSHAGELTRLASMGHPDIAVITNAGSAHLENFADKNGLVQAKGEIFNGLSSDGIAVINGDDPAADYWSDLAAPRNRKLFAFENSAADIRGQWQPTETGGLLKVSGDAGNWQVDLPLLGRENGINALAAITVGHCLGLSGEQMSEALKQCKPVAGRLQPLLTPAGARLIDDSYNASPDSVRVAIDVLAQQGGQRTLILGAMAELGTDSEAFHRDAGIAARDAGIDRLLTVGDQSRFASEAFGEGGRHYPNQQDLLADLPLPGERDTLLVKGSRVAAMEKVVRSLMTSSE
ncbi:MAG: UDP-N-acetylmuramoyl-tripeptide--D-alanyl-D-alanine ligase, partial [Gammaproteobacteria bacterium]